MARITIPAIGSIGVVRDQQPQELPAAALTNALNIRMRDGSAEKIAGETPVFTTPSVVPIHLQLMATHSDRFVVHAGEDAIFADNGTTKTDITGTAPTGGPADRWTGGVLNGVLVMNNGIDVPTYWAGDVSANLATLTGWTSTWKCGSLRPFRNYLIAMNFTKNTAYYPSMVKWSAPADPGTIPSTWDEADPTNDAGETELAETPDTIVDGLALGDTFIIYKGSSMYAMTYIGGAYIWQFRRLPGESGILARGCACNTPAGHLVLTAGDAIIHSGAGPQSILSGKMRKWLFSEMDSNFYARSFVVSNPGMNEAWICFPGAGSEYCTKALIWNWAESTFSIRDLSNVACATSGQFEYSSGAAWSDDTETWEEDVTVWSQSDLPLSQSRIIMGTSAPSLLAGDIGPDFSGTAHQAMVERTGITFDDPERVKTVRSIFPRIDGTTGGTVYVQVGGAMDVEGPYTWTDAVPYVIGSTYRADMFAAGRFIAYRVYSTAAIDWRIKSMDIDVVVSGAY